MVCKTSGYTLLPSTEFACDPGRKVETRHECKAAASYIDRTLRDSRIVSGKWSWLPSECSAPRSIGSDVHFNYETRNTLNVHTNDWARVCKNVGYSRFPWRREPRCPGNSRIKNVSDLLVLAATLTMVRSIFYHFTLPFAFLV